jgi:hypothetical protein
MTSATLAVDYATDGVVDVMHRRLRQLGSALIYCRVGSARGVALESCKGCRVRLLSESVS